MLPLLGRLLVEATRLSLAPHLPATRAEVVDAAEHKTQCSFTPPQSHKAMPPASCGMQRLQENLASRARCTCMLGCMGVFSCARYSTVVHDVILSSSW